MKQARSQTRRSAGCKGLWRGGRGLRYLRCADRCSGDALAGRAVKNGPGRHVRGRPPNKREAHQLTELQIAAAGSTAALGLFLPLVGWQTSPTQAAATQSGACGGAVLCRVHGGARGTFATGREFFSMFLCKGHLLAVFWRLGSSSPTKLRERVLRILDLRLAQSSIANRTGGRRPTAWGAGAHRLATLRLRHATPIPSPTPDHMAPQQKWFEVERITRLPPPRPRHPSLTQAEL